MLNKFKIKSISALLLAVLLFGCSKELDQKPESAVSPEQISAENVGFFLNGLYRRSLPDRDHYVLGDIRGGNYTWTALSGSSGSYGNLITGNNIDDRLGFSSGLWSHAYRNIFNANIIMEAVDRLGAEGNLATVKAETSYLRAWHYYQLVTHFGAVPLILSNTTENIPRNTTAEIWQQIHADIDYAISHARPLSVSGTKKVSVEAARALKSRMLVDKGKKEQAAALAESFISSASRSIDDDYGMIFRNTDASN